MYYDKGYKAVYIEGFGLGGMPFLKNDFTGKVGEVIEKGMLVLAGSQCRYEAVICLFTRQAALHWKKV